MNPGDRLVCAFVNPAVKAGAEFKDWPLHVTIVPWFRTDMTTGQLTAELKEALSGISSFTSTAGPSAKFGYTKGKVASLIQKPTPLDEIEKRVRQTLTIHEAWLVDESTRRRRDYKPHVTVQQSE